MPTGEPAETEGDEFDELIDEPVDPLDREDADPFPRPPPERQEPKPGRPAGWVAQHAEKERKAKGKKSKARPAAEEPEAEAAGETPPLTEDALSMVEVMAVFPLILASQWLSTPNRKLVYHNEGIREIKLAARKYAKYVYQRYASASMLLDPLSVLLCCYAMAIAGAYIAAEKRGGTAAPAAGNTAAPGGPAPAEGSKSKKTYQTKVDPTQHGGPVHIVQFR